MQVIMLGFFPRFSPPREDGLPRNLASLFRRQLGRPNLAALRPAQFSQGNGVWVFFLSH